MKKALEQPQLFDYRELAADDRGYVKDRAERIRDVAKKTAQGIILIGQWLTEAKSRLKHGQWLPWLETEFGWTDRTARKLMLVHESFKSEQYSDLEIDVSALYLISAPKTPEPVRKEVIARAQAGEPMTHAKAVEVHEAYKAKAELPTPAVARQIAIATGKAVPSSDNKYVQPMSKRDEALLADEQAKIRGLYVAIESIAKAGISPAAMATLGRKHSCRSLASWSLIAGKWLLNVAEQLEG